MDGKRTRKAIFLLLRAERNNPSAPKCDKWHRFILRCYNAKFPLLFPSEVPLNLIHNYGLILFVSPEFSMTKKSLSNGWVVNFKDSLSVTGIFFWNLSFWQVSLQKSGNRDDAVENVKNGNSFRTLANKLLFKNNNVFYNSNFKLHFAINYTGKSHIEITACD